jgi:hypothetical protein
MQVFFSKHHLLKIAKTQSKTKKVTKNINALITEYFYGS